MVSRWARHNSVNRSRVDRSFAPDRGDEYLFYQALLGAWPVESVDLGALASRLRDYMIKAIREAKLHTSWIQEDAEYERATARFVEECLTGRRAPGFLDSFVPFATRVARSGMVNSLAQVVLKLASPGVPDIFQGAELWDLNLVDPDNRRPVDFGRRRRWLDELDPAVRGLVHPPRRGEMVRDWLQHWETGAIKLYVTACGLRLRRARPAPFLEGDYVPLETSGERADHVVAFARVGEDAVVLAVVPRLVATRTGGPPLGLPGWGDTLLQLPEALGSLRFEDAFTGAIHEPVRDGRGATLRVAGILADLPVALLASQPA